MPVTTALELAKAILASFEGVNKPINNLKLQKLLYYAQAWHLALRDTPIFAEPVEAWVHGPVVPTVFQEYRDFRWNPIKHVNTTHGKMPSAIVGHLKEVLGVYGAYDGITLEQMTHAEDPWKIARRGIAPDVASRSIISHESMKRYYRSV